jgi:dihydrosphingosine 1-phosphate phosphatase
MVNQHPVPIDDCPCFEDAIAFVSVLMGSLLGRWHAVHYGFDASFFGTSMPGSAGSGWADRSMWWSVAAIKMIFGAFVMLQITLGYINLHPQRHPHNIHLAYLR